MSKHITLVLDEDLAQLALLALRDAENRLLGDSFPLDRFLPDLASRQALVEAYHEYNGDPEVFAEDLTDSLTSEFRFFDPNRALGMLEDRLHQAIKEAGIEVRADQPEMQDLY